MRTFLSLLLLLVIASTSLLAADTDDTEVKNVVQRFHDALDRHDVAAIGSLVSPNLVVFENGHRNDGWTDFRDNHLIPEFKEPAVPSKWVGKSRRHSRHGMGIHEGDAPPDVFLSSCRRL